MDNLKDLINHKEFIYKNRKLSQAYVPEYWSVSEFEIGLMDYNSRYDYIIQIEKWIVKNLTGLWAIRISKTITTVKINVFFEDPDDMFVFSLMGGPQAILNAN